MKNVLSVSTDVRETILKTSSFITYEDQFFVESNNYNFCLISLKLELLLFEQHKIFAFRWITFLIFRLALKFPSALPSAKRNRVFHLPRKKSLVMISLAG